MPKAFPLVGLLQEVAKYKGPVLFCLPCSSQSDDENAPIVTNV